MPGFVADETALPDSGRSDDFGDCAGVAIESVPNFFRRGKMQSGDFDESPDGVGLRRVCGRRDRFVACDGLQRVAGVGDVVVW